MAQQHEANNIPGLSSMTQLTVSQEKLQGIDSQLDAGESMSLEDESNSHFAQLSQAASISLAAESSASSIESQSLKVESQVNPENTAQSVSSSSSITVQTEHTEQPAAAHNLKPSDSTSNAATTLSADQTAKSSDSSTSSSSTSIPKQNPTPNSIFASSAVQVSQDDLTSHAAPAHNVSSLLASYSAHAALSPQASTKTATVSPVATTAETTPATTANNHVLEDSTAPKVTIASNAKLSSDGTANNLAAKDKHSDENLYQGIGKTMSQAESNEGTVDLSVEKTAEFKAQNSHETPNSKEAQHGGQTVEPSPQNQPVQQGKETGQERTVGQETASGQGQPKLQSGQRGSDVQDGESALDKDKLFSQSTESNKWLDDSQSAKVSHIKTYAPSANTQLEVTYTVNTANTANNHNEKFAQPLSGIPAAYQALSTRVRLTNTPYPQSVLQDSQQVRPQGVQAWDQNYGEGAHKLNEIKSDDVKLDKAKDDRIQQDSVKADGISQTKVSKKHGTDDHQLHNVQSGKGRVEPKGQSSLAGEKPLSSASNPSADVPGTADSAFSLKRAKVGKVASGTNEARATSEANDQTFNATDIASKSKDSKNNQAAQGTAESSLDDLVKENKSKVAQDEDTQALLKRKHDDTVEADKDGYNAYVGKLHGKAAKIAAYTENAGIHELCFAPRKWLKALCGLGALCVGILLFIEHEWHVFGWEQPHNAPVETAQQIASTSPYLVDSAVIMPGSDDSDAIAAGSLFKNPGKPNTFELIKPFTAAEINEKITIKQLDIERALKHEAEGREPSEKEQDCLIFRQTLNNYHALSVQLKPYLTSKKTRQELKAAINATPERIMRFTFPGQAKASVQGWCLVVEDTLGDIEKRQMFVFPTPSARTMANRWIDWYNRKCLTQKHLNVDILKSYRFETALLDLSLLPHNSSLFPYAGQSERAEIRKMQSLLNALDHPVGKADGIAGAKTRQEIRKAEKELFTDKNDKSEYEGMDGDVSHALLLFLHFFDSGFDNHSSSYM